MRSLSHGGALLDNDLTVLNAHAVFRINSGAAGEIVNLAVILGSIYLDSRNTGDGLGGIEEAGRNMLSTGEHLLLTITKGADYEVALFYNCGRNGEVVGVRHINEFARGVVNLEADRTGTAVAVNGNATVLVSHFIGRAFEIVAEIGHHTNITYFASIAGSSVVRGGQTHLAGLAAHTFGLNLADSLIDEEDTGMRLRILAHVLDGLVNVGLRCGKPVGMIVARIVLCNRFEETIELEEFGEVFFCNIAGEHRKLEIVVQSANGRVLIRGIRHGIFTQLSKEFGIELGVMSLELVVEPKLEVNSATRPNVVFIAESTTMEVSYGVGEGTSTPLRSYLATNDKLARRSSPTFLCHRPY